MKTTFEGASEMARERGCRLVRAADSRGCRKSGFVLYLPHGTWTGFATLAEVTQYLGRRFTL